MSTAKQVRDAWKEYVWNRAPATDYTPNIYQFDITNIAQGDFSDLVYEGEVNFFTAVNVKQQRPDVGVNCITYDHLVQVQYYLSPSLPTERGRNYNRVIDRLEALEAAIRADADFGKSWNSTIDYWQVRDVQEPALIQFGESAQVWRGTYIYAGEEKVDL